MITIGCVDPLPHASPETSDAAIVESSGIEPSVPKGGKASKDNAAPTKKPPAPDEDEGPDEAADAGADRSDGVAVPVSSAGQGGSAGAPNGGAGAGGRGGSANAGAGGATGGKSAPQPPSHGSIVGTWRGVVTDIQAPMFNMCMQVMQVDSPGPAGTTKYFGSTNCGGQLEYVGFDGDVYTFNERITSGIGCIPAGRMEVRLRTNGTLDWQWFSTNAVVPRETSSLERAQTCP